MSKNPWIDVSVPLHNKMHHWPGDPPPFVTNHVSTAKGDVCNVSAFFMSSHTGTHMDAPLHFLHGAKTMDDLLWDAVIGPARVIEIKDREAIKPAELKKMKLRKGERIIFKTRNSSVSWKKPEFDKDFVYVSKEASQYLVDCGIQTVGVDYLSVGGFYKDGIETHHILLGAEVWIIEGLDLSKIKPGNYDLLCLPIKFQNGDGAPSRCLLRKR
ncbi:MAG: cyclase family protein [Chthoniobacteraceae bacterium]